MRHDYTINGDSALYSTLDEIQRLYKEHRYLSIRIDTGKQRTITQNRALHLFCRQTANVLNDAGLECHTNVPSTGRVITVPWNEGSVKDALWRPVQKAMIGKESTIDAERADYGEIHKVLCARLGESFGVTLPDWPRKKEDDE